MLSMVRDGDKKKKVMVAVRFFSFCCIFDSLFSRTFLAVRGGEQADFYPFTKKVDRELDGDELDGGKEGGSGLWAQKRSWDG